MSDAEVTINDGEMMEFFKSAFISELVGSKAESIASQANANAHAVMHTPNIDPYVSKVVIADKCALGIVGGGSIGAALDNKYGCLRSCV